MINPKKKLWTWGPIDGKPIYPSYFMFGVEEGMKKLFDVAWSETLFFFEKDKMTFLCEDDKLRKVGKYFFNKYAMNDKNFITIQDNYNKALEELRDIQRKITNKFLNNCNEVMLKEVYHLWEKAYYKFWNYGLVPETANFGGEIILSKQLSKYDQKEKIFEIMATPERLSFYQKEEYELQKVKNEKDLRNHVRKYYWIRNSYYGTIKSNISYFRKRLRTVKPVKGYTNKMILRKRNCVKKYNLSKKLQKTARRLSYCIWWQDHRKAQIFEANYYIDLFLKQLSKRKKIKYYDLQYYSASEIRKLIDRDVKQNVKDRHEFCIYKNKGFITKRSKIIDTIDTKGEISNFNLKGISVSAGRAKGKARIMKSSNDYFRKGEILVTSMTSPEFIVAIKKAAAIITDAGGMTSHVAIVSRELGIPCIVGTKYATKVLKNGDLVEVNADNGIIKHIKE